MRSLTNLAVVGQPLRRADASAKVSGAAGYAADLELPGMLHAKLLRSPHAHARIVRIDATRARSCPGVRAVLTRHDIPQHVDPLIGYFVKDRELVARDKVRFVGDVVAAVAADTERQAIEALAMIEVDYAVLPAVMCIEDALTAGAPELFEDSPRAIVPHYGKGAGAELRPRPNVCYEFRYRTGASDAFDRCDHVFEDEFRFSRMTHFTLEPFVSIASATRDRIQIWTSTHTPFLVRKEISRIFRMPENAVNVQVPFVGGSYGAKGNCRNEPVAVQLSLASGRPVRLALSVEEGFLTNSQHAAILRLKTGVSRDGRLIARRANIFLDAGAYSDASPLVAEKAGYRIPGPYRYEFIDSSCSCVMTNTVPAGAFRGFGGTQATWASESQIDMIARRLKIDPYDFRKRNLLGLHEPFVPGESGIDSDPLAGLDVVAEAIGYRAPREQAHRGRGLAIGFKDGGGVNKPAQARVKISTDGDVFLHCGTVELGQGAHTALCQIVAETLQVPLARVRYVPLSTDTAPFDQGTNASSSMTVMGNAVARAAGDVKARVLDFAAVRMGCDVAALELDNWTIHHGAEAIPMARLIQREFGGTGYEFTGEGFFKVELDPAAPLESKSAFWEFGWVGADVEVDVETGRVIVHRLVVSADAGRAINPLTCRGQDEGSALMGLGQALFERMIYDGERLANLDPLEYRVPLAEDLPERFVSHMQEQGHGPGPFGSKGVAEGGILAVSSAIANAIEDAVGVRIRDLPITAEKVLRALSLKHGGDASAPVAQVRGRQGLAPSDDEGGGRGGFPLAK